MLDGDGGELLDGREPHHTLDGDGAVGPDLTPVVGLGESPDRGVAGHHEVDDLVAVLFEERADDDVGDGIHIGVFSGWVRNESITGLFAFSSGFFIFRFFFNGEVDAEFGVFVKGVEDDALDVLFVGEGQAKFRTGLFAF